MQQLAIAIPPDNPASHISGFLDSLESLIDPDLWSMRPVYLDEGPADDNRWLRDHAERGGSVIWYFARPQDCAMIRRLTDSGNAVVTYNRDYREHGAHAVIADVEEVVRQQFERLWRPGKRRFAVLSTDRPSPSIRQYRKLAEELAIRAGVGEAFRQVRLPYAAKQRPSEEMLAQIDALMSSDPPPDAVMCTDIFSFRGLEVWLAKHRHVRVPEDLGVATFDPVPYANVQRLNHQIPMGMMDQPRMLQAAIRMLETHQCNPQPQPQLQRIPATMAGDVRATVTPIGIRLTRPTAATAACAPAS